MSYFNSQMHPSMSFKQWKNSDDVINLFGETNDGSFQLRIGFNNY